MAILGRHVHWTSNSSRDLMKQGVPGQFRNSFPHGPIEILCIFTISVARNIFEKLPFANFQNFFVSKDEPKATFGEIGA